MVERALNKNRQRNVVPFAGAVMEALDERCLFDADLQLQEVALPTTGNVMSPGQAVQVRVDMQNLGSTAVNQSFTVEAKLSPYAIAEPADSLVLSFDDPLAFDLGSVVFSTAMPAQGPIQSAIINTTVPADLQPGTYAILIKVDSLGQLAEANEGNNEGGFLDVAVLASGGEMILSGTNFKDSITLTRTNAGGHPSMEVALSDRTALYNLAGVNHITVNAREDDDIVIANGSLGGLRIDGGDGNDKLIGGDLEDTLIGGANKDTLFGGLGNDRLNGNGGNDRLFGEAGADRLYGYDGNDYLDGGSSGDRLEGNGGVDTMLGQSGNDKFFAKDGAIDQLFGATGSDTGSIDANDVLSSVETTSTT